VVPNPFVVPKLFHSSTTQETPVNCHQVPLTPKWYSPKEVAVLLGYGLSKVKMKIATGELRSVKDGKYRRILPQWVDEYIQNLTDDQDAA
jgi:excisionase family DNA binding protein